MASMIIIWFVEIIFDSSSFFFNSNNDLKNLRKKMEENKLIWTISMNLFFS